MTQTLHTHKSIKKLWFQVRYAIKEYAATAVDILARRLRLSFLNVQAAEEALPRIIEIMAEELKWSRSEKQKQTEDAVKFLNTQMGKEANRAAKESIPITLTKSEISEYVKRFNTWDTERKGYLTIKDIRKMMRVSFWLFVTSLFCLCDIIKIDTVLHILLLLLIMRD